MTEVKDKIKEDLHLFYRLNEDLSISSEVRDAVCNIKQVINDTIKRGGIPNSYHTKYSYKMSMNVFDTIIYITLNLISFMDYRDFSDEGKNYSFDCEMRYSKDSICNMILNVPIINNTIYRYYLDDNLSHELYHYYEYLKRGNNTSLTNFEDIRFYNSLYAKVKSGLYTDKEKDIAMSLYYSYRFERCAFAHGLDGVLSKYRETHNVGERNMNDIYDIFTTTDEYKYMEIMHRVLDNISNYKTEILRISNMDMKKFERFLRKRYKEFRNAMHKVLLKTYESIGMKYDNVSIIFGD